MTALAAQVCTDANPCITAPSVAYNSVMPVLIILGAACVAVLFEALLPRGRRFGPQVALTLFAVLAAGVWTVVAGTRHLYGLTFSSAVAVDGATYVTWGVLLVLALVSVMLMADRVTEPGGAFVAQAAALVGSSRDRAAAQAAAPMQTEVFPLTLFAIGGMMVFPAANDLLTLFVALEVLSLPLYLMCGLARRRRLISQESAVKYFLLGAFTSAILLYGIALLYGYSGAVTFAGINAAASAGQGSDALLISGLALITVGLLFKASVGPFHLWTPDVYQGAPTPVTAFMGACTKVAAFAALLRVFSTAGAPLYWTWRPVLYVVAILSMMIGAVLGLVQSDMKRVLAYSSIAHAGFILLGVMSLSSDGASGTLFYLLTYGFATVGAFAIVTVVRRGNGEATDVGDWAGLAKRSPVLAAIMSLFLLSFAGIPLTSGFIGKFKVFTAASAAGMGWLVVVAMVATAITAFFYLKVVVLMYFSPRVERAQESTGTAGPGFESVGAPDGTDRALATATIVAPRADQGGVFVVIPSVFTSVVIGVSALVTLVLGIAPSWFLQLLAVKLPLAF